MYRASAKTQGRICFVSLGIEIPIRVFYVTQCSQKLKSSAKRVIVQPLIRLRLPSFCVKFYLKFCTPFSGSKVNTSGSINKKRRKMEVRRPFEPSSTDVHPCTSVEGEFRWKQNIAAADRMSVVLSSIEFFDKKNSKFKNVQGRTFLNDAIRGGSG